MSLRDDGPVRVVLVDRSAIFRNALSAGIHRYDAVRVVAGAASAAELRTALLQHHPEVIVIDLGLERNDAFRLIQRLRHAYPVPILALVPEHPGREADAVRALKAGVVEVLIRPPQGDFAGARMLGEKLVRRIRAAIHTARPIPTESDREPRRSASFTSTGVDPAKYIVVIGSSTGGPQALRTLLRCIPTDFPPIVIVQHMPAFFTASFAANVDRDCSIVVREAGDGDSLTPGVALVARGDTHLIVARRGLARVVRYTDQRPVNLHCPSVDVLFDSAVSFGSTAIGVLLTGMGADGAHGLLRMRRTGALTLAQDQRSSIVYGMPKVANELGAVQITGRPEQIPGLIARAIAKRDGSRSPATTAGVK